jgi:hypothetical protein
LQIPDKSHQLCFFENYTKESLHHPLGTKDLATLFELNERTVRNSLLHGRQQPGPLGRHAALNAEVESSLVWMLLDAFHEEKAVAQKDFSRIMREQHKPTLTKG